MLTHFYESLRNVPGLTILSGAQEIEAYRPDTGGATRYPAAALSVTEVSAVPRILDVANLHRVPLWPISGGRNFGYGTAQAVKAGKYNPRIYKVQHVSAPVEGSGGAFRGTD